MATNKRWKCNRCGELMTEEQTAELTYCTFAGSREEPPEYAGGCANSRCNGTHEDQEEVWLCSADDCEQEAMDDDDLCDEHFGILEHEGTLDPGGDVDHAGYMMEDR